MPASKSFQEYSRQKAEEDWQRKVDKRKKELSNDERIQTATEYKKIGADKFKSGNISEAIEYYREAYCYVHDLVDARRRERVKLTVPLLLNLALCYEKQGDKVVQELEREKVKFDPAQFGVQYKSAPTNNEDEEEEDEVPLPAIARPMNSLPLNASQEGRQKDAVALYEKMRHDAREAVRIADIPRNEVEATFVLKSRLRLAVAGEKLRDWELAARELKKILQEQQLLQEKVCLQNRKTADGVDLSKVEAAQRAFVEDALTRWPRVSAALESQRASAAVPRGFLNKKKKVTQDHVDAHQARPNNTEGKDTDHPSKKKLNDEREHQQEGDQVKDHKKDQGSDDDPEAEAARKAFSSQVFEKLAKSKGNKMLYEERDRAMEPAREKIAHDNKVLDLERELMNIVVEKDSEKAATLEEYQKHREARFETQEEQLGYKKKVLDKIEAEKKIAEETAWAQRLEKQKRTREQQKASVRLRTGNTAAGSQTIHQPLTAGDDGDNDLHVEEIDASTGQPLAHDKLQPANAPPPTSNFGHQSMECERLLKHRLKEILLGVALESDDDLPQKSVYETIGKMNVVDEGEGSYCLKGLIANVEVEGDCGVFRTKSYHAEAFHYWDFKLEIDWEVCVARRGAKSYRHAEDIMKEVAKGYREPVSEANSKTGAGHCDAPPTIAKNALTWGRFSILDFSSDEKGEYDQEALQFSNLTEHKCERGGKLTRWSEDLATDLGQVVRKRLTRFVTEFRNMDVE
ncbi:unnamed protein product [Amoebophrya sp. A25]|nr:unnamed protein product [Amoebophrya sp. A25]|eukprot:GSA25T00011140001.1